MTTFRLLTANLFNGRAKPDTLARVLAEVDPDVAAFQELGPNSAFVVRAAFAHGHLDPRPDYRGKGVVGKAPLEVAPVPMDHRSGWSARLDPGDWPGLPMPLHVINVHLVNPIDRPVRRAIETRRRQLAALRTFVGGLGEPYLIVGDMNATRWWPAYRELRRLGVDAARATETAQRTWAPRWWMPRLLRIDYVFAHGVRPLGTRTIGIRGTDHSGLVVDFEVE
jgi:endonuclease/exonuclease/phosphatase family metal-dependent hydrolase